MQVKDRLKDYPNGLHYTHEMQKAGMKVIVYDAARACVFASPIGTRAMRMLGHAEFERIGGGAAGAEMWVTNEHHPEMLDLWAS